MNRMQHYVVEKKKKEEKEEEKQLKICWQRRSDRESSKQHRVKFY